MHTLRAWSATRSNRRPIVESVMSISGGIRDSRTASTSSVTSLPRSASTAGSLTAAVFASSASCLANACDRVVEHRDGDVGHLDEAPAERLGRLGQVAQAEDLPGDALGVVADPLQLEVDLDGAVGEAEVDADGLLPHEELEAEPVDLLLLLVDELVAQDDGVGPLAVAAASASTQSRSARSARPDISRSCWRIRSMSRSRESSRRVGILFLMAREEAASPLSPCSGGR